MRVSFPSASRQIPPETRRFPCHPPGRQAESGLSNRMRLPRAVPIVSDVLTLEKEIVSIVCSSVEKTGCTAASTARIAAIPADKKGRSFRNITITSFTIQHVPDFDSGFGNMNAAIYFTITDIIPDINMF